MATHQTNRYLNVVILCLESKPNIATEYYKLANDLQAY